MATRSRSYGLLDCRSPVEWSHPLNQGLVGEWAAPPLTGWRGSLVLRDLVRGGKVPHDGTLVNGPTWESTTAPGGYKQLGFLQTSQQSVLCGSMPPLYTASSASFGSLFYVPGLALKSSNYTGVLTYGQASDVIYSLSLTAGSSTQNKLLFEVQNSLGSYQDSPSYSISAGKWYFVVGTVGGGAISLCVFSPSDATQTTSNAYTGSPKGGSSSYNFSIGRDWFTTANDRFFNGFIAASFLYNRAISFSESTALYAEYSQGNPNRWRWVRGTVYSFPGVAPAGARVNVAAYMKRSVRISPSLGATR